ncbi:MAG TPA: TIGR03862 family flavoprotein [Paucimonas sp.]|nr:TIGR03862 family flavoprotein [Paucimonas sp.]HJW56534.1 TIGR03862 family flavoprotein [Burkholderiaceae bacterium]
MQPIDPVSSCSDTRSVAIIGGGPAGLMAAEALCRQGVQVDLYDGMPSVGRKFLLAGKGGMNITHAEPMDAFLSRYGARRAQLAPLLDAFGPAALRAWMHELGIETFVGSSGRIFPNGMKAAPLLRAWLQRLRAGGVRFHMRHRWQGWDDAGQLRFAAPAGERAVRADAVILALGGGSWPRLGSDGAWVALLEQQGVPVQALRPANCGFDVGWSAHFRERFAGQPVKSVIASISDASGQRGQRPGEFMITATGVEGSLIYALSAPLRDAIVAHGTALLHLDLAPGKDLQRVTAEVAHPRGARSLSSHLQSRVGIHGVKMGLLRELLPASDFADPARLAAAIKALPLRLVAPRPIAEAISSAGGVAFEGLDERLMLRALPGVFCAGEMLDWEAPTGGYLLTACFASGRAAGLGAAAWLHANCR